MPAFVGAPPIETERLKLRAHRPEDHAAAVAMWSDPLVVRYIGGKPSTAEESWSRLIRYAGLWPFLGFGYWALEEKHTGQFLGEAGFADFKREIAPGLSGAPEIGWALASAAHGQGFAKEAIQAIVAWGDRHLDAARTVCIIDPENEASLHLAQRAGYREFARLPYKGVVEIALERRRA